MRDTEHFCGTGKLPRAAYLPVSIGRLALWLFALWFLFLSQMAKAQLPVHHIYYDSLKEHLKAKYQVKDTIGKIAHGKYTSFFSNGNIHSTGYFNNNEPIGEWKFFYEAGGLRMTTSPLKDSIGYSLRVHYYSSGKKSAAGRMHGKERIGTWRMYFEDEVLQSEIEYHEGRSKYTGYYHSGEIQSKGERKGMKNTGYWYFFYKNGVVSGEGGYKNGKKTGLWKYYHPSGSNLSSSGKYEAGKRTGVWKYFFENGQVSSQGKYLIGKKDGQWDTFDVDGNIAGRETFEQGTGKAVQFYPSGEIKATGEIKDDKKNGDWTYFYEDGSKKGDCHFDMGSGVYHGYYADGTPQTKGQIENHRRTGLWEIYDHQGALTGYYRPFHEDKEMEKTLNRKEIPHAEPIHKDVPSLKNPRKKGSYFTPRFYEYKGIIVQTNPFFTFIGVLPMSLEFYAQGRLGYEFLFEIIRNPFFKPNDQIERNKIFNRGYNITIKQKFYHPIKRLGMWYFGHEIVFSSIIHSSNMSSSSPAVSVVARASEMKAEYGPTFGVRFMWGTGRNGFTIDANAGLVIGYRSFTSSATYDEVFSSLNKGPFAYTFRFGVNFGYSISVRN